jgi:hypothetical protein
MDNLALALNGLDLARTVAKADEWAKWWKELESTPEMDDEFTDRYHLTLERVTGTTPCRQAPHSPPAPELVGAKADNIPF